MIDKWLYVLKNLHRLQDIPKILQERIFKKLFNAAEIANYNAEEMNAYEESLKTLRDNHATAEFVERELARAEAMAQEANAKMQEANAKTQEVANKMRRAAKKMKQDGLNIPSIMEYTGLSQEEIEKL